MTVKRVLVSLLLAVAVLGLGAAAAVGWALATEPGTAWLLARIEARAAPRLAIGTVQGTLWRGLILRDVRLSLDADELSLSRMELQLDVAALLGSVVAVDELAIAEVTYARADTPAASRGGAMADSLRVLIRRGSIERLRVVSADQPLALGPIGFSVVLDGRRLTIADLEAKLEGFDIAGSAELRLETALGLSAELDWSAEVDSVALAGRGRIDGAFPALRIEQALSSPFPASASGTITLGRNPRAELQVRWSELAWPGLALGASPMGEMRVSGWLDEYVFEGTGDVVVEDVAAGFSVSGSGTPTTLSFDSLALSSLYGEIAARGQVGIDSSSWTLDIEARNLDPSPRFADWPGKLAVDGKLRGSLEPELEWSLSDVTVKGVLREQAVTAMGGLAFLSPGTWRLDAVTVQSGENDITVDGTVGAEIDLDLAIAASELGAVWPGAAGALTLDGALSGTRDAPELAGTLEGRALALGDYAIESIVVGGELALRNDAPFELEIAAGMVRWRDALASSVTGSVSGTSATHAIELDAESALGSGRLRATGALSSEAWSGRVSTLRIDQPLLGPWELAEPAGLEIGRESLNLDSMCIRRGQTSLCGFARIGDGVAAAELTLTELDLSVLNVFLSEDVSLEGTYNASATMGGPIGRPTGELRVSGVSTLVSVQEPDAPPLAIPIERLDFGAVLTEDSLEINGGLDGIGGARVTLEGNVVDVWSDDPGLRAELDGVWTDLGLISLLSPEIGEVSGTATLSVDVAGSLESPRLAGEARWLEGQIDVPRWGFLIEGIDVRASSADGAEVVLEASGIAGEGRIDVDGTMALDPDAGWPTRLSIRGESLQAVRLPDTEIFVSPELEIETALPTVLASGTVRIPRARLVLDEIPAQAVVPSPDTVIHGAVVQPPRRPLDVRGDLRVVLGDDIRYSGGGLDVALSGEMGLVYESGRNAIGSGEVNLDGQYRTYGQALDLERGRLLFNGPIDNPALDVRAVRRIDSTTVGVQLGGTVEAPTTRIFSEPAMSEADALAYLLFGRPLSGSGDQETATLQSAALSMGLQQALPVVQRFGQSLGLDELTVQATEADAGELMAGKQISPRIYMRYSYGLFNRIGGLLMRLRLNERFSIETRSGDNKAMDLMYTVEKE